MALKADPVPELGRGAAGKVREEGEARMVERELRRAQREGLRAQRHSLGWDGGQDSPEQSRERRRG